MEMMFAFKKRGCFQTLCFRWVSSLGFRPPGRVLVHFVAFELPQGWTYQPNRSVKIPAHVTWSGQPRCLNNSRHGGVEIKDRVPWWFWSWVEEGGDTTWHSTWLCLTYLFRYIHIHIHQENCVLLLWFAYLKRSQALAVSKNKIDVGGAIWRQECPKKILVRS